MVTLTLTFFSLVSLGLIYILAKLVPFKLSSLFLNFPILITIIILRIYYHPDSFAGMGTAIINATVLEWISGLQVLSIILIMCIGTVYLYRLFLKLWT